MALPDSRGTARPFVAGALGSTCSSGAALGSVPGSALGSAPGCALGWGWGSKGPGWPEGACSGSAKPTPLSRTGRKVSSADCRTRSRVSSSGCPGRPTRMLLAPCLVTSASVTPVPLTRWRMISTAWSIDSGGMSSVSSAAGVRMICVPPSRSSARFGVQEAGVFSSKK